MSKMSFVLLSIMACLVSCTTESAIAQEARKNPPKPTTSDAPIVADSGKIQLADNLAKFQRLLTGSKLIGQFTVDGKVMDKLPAEEYEITKVEKAPEGDLWIITSRIKYGNKDVTLPVPLEVKWAGSTPVLTLDNLTLPGLGTFSARIVLHRDKYAGTWQHDDNGGHMFGRIELPKQATETK